MQMMSVKNYNEKAEMNVNIPQHANTGLKRLDLFLSRIKKSHPHLIDKIFDYLNNNWVKLKKIPSLSLVEYEILNEYPILVSKALGTLFAYMDLNAYDLPSKSETASINVIDYLRSSLFFSYSLIESLLKIMSKEEAINYYKDYIDTITKSSRDPSQYLENLEAMRPSGEEFQNRFQSHDFINFSIHSGKIGTKTTKCKWHEVMKELKNPELSYAVCCHYDFEATLNMNPNFVLTRNQTLMEGAPYCDFCYHDLRLVDSIEHPPKEFWEQLK